MKTRILFLIAVLSFISLRATNNTKSTSKIGVTSLYNESVTFIERGVKFHVFLNGDFDFNTHRNNQYYDINGRRYTDRGIRIERDFNGKVRRVGNVFINYDFYGNVKRIGNVYMRYNRGYLTRVGNMNIRYDRWGNPHFKGYVKANNYHHNYYNDNHCGVSIDMDIFDYDNAYFYRRDFNKNYRKFKEDRDFLYYRAVPNAQIGKRSKVLKRRKIKRGIQKRNAYKLKNEVRKYYAEPSKNLRKRSR